MPQTGRSLSLAVGKVSAPVYRSSESIWLERNATMSFPHPVLSLILDIILQSQDAGIGTHGSLLILWLSQLKCKSFPQPTGKSPFSLHIFMYLLVPSASAENPVVAGI